MTVDELLVELAKFDGNLEVFTFLTFVEGDAAAYPIEELHLTDLGPDGPWVALLNYERGYGQ